MIEGDFYKPKGAKFLKVLKEAVNPHVPLFFAFLEKNESDRFTIAMEFIPSDDVFFQNNPEVLRHFATMLGKYALEYYKVYQDMEKEGKL